MVQWSLKQQIVSRIIQFLLRSRDPTMWTRGYSFPYQLPKKPTSILPSKPSFSFIPPPSQWVCELQDVFGEYCHHRYPFFKSCSLVASLVSGKLPSFLLLYSILALRKESADSQTLQLGDVAGYGSAMGRLEGRCADRKRLQK